MGLLYAVAAEPVVVVIHATIQTMRNRREKSALFARNGNRSPHFTSTRFASMVWNHCASNANSGSAKSATPNILTESGEWT
jgi:hypothetical protein